MSLLMRALGAARCEVAPLLRPACVDRSGRLLSTSSPASSQKKGFTERVEDMGARVEDATEHSSTAGKADAGARRAGFAVPPPGPDSSDAPSPGVAAAMGPGPGMMGGADDLVSGSARGDKARAAEGMDEMTHGAAPDAAKRDTHDKRSSAPGSGAARP